MLDQERYHSEEEQEDVGMNMEFDKRGDVKLGLSKTAEKSIEAISQSYKIKNLLHPHLDEMSRAEQQICEVEVQREITFEHYFLKNKYKDERKKLFNEIRDLLRERGFRDDEISRIEDKEQDSIMVVRVIAKVEGTLNSLLVEDETHKEKLVIRQGVMWLGMICAIRAKWADGAYKLQKIIDLSKPTPSLKAHLSAHLTANRTMVVRGPFRMKYKPNYGGDRDEGIRLVTKQIQRLKRQKNMVINQLVVMGPLLSKTNREVQKFKLDKTYEQQYEHILATLRVEVNKVNSDIKIFVMPSLDDIVSLYPLPQPAYVYKEQQKHRVRCLSNPSSLSVQGKRSSCRIDLVNYDLLGYIDTHKTARTENKIMEENLATYLKQPFLLTNTTTNQEPIDEINLAGLYNAGDFGDLVVFSSTRLPPFARRVDDRVIVNVGSLGVEPNDDHNSFMVILSVFEGEGTAADRLKVDMIHQI